jgi:uncharacterized membrane protein
MISHELSTFLTAMIPIGEIRVALPLALISYKMNIWIAYGISVFGNLLPIFFLLFFWKYLAEFLMKKSKFFNNFFNWLFARARRKFQGSYEKWGKIALIIFVGIPLPITGAWTGSIVAWLFGFKYWEGLFLNFLGICLAGIIVALLTLGGIKFF